MILIARAPAIASARSETTDSIIILVRSVLTIAASIAILLWMNARLSLIALTMGPLVGWLVSIINRYFRRYSRRIQDSMGDVTRVAKESFEAPRLLKVYNAEAYLTRQFDAVNEHKTLVAGRVVGGLGPQFTPSRRRVSTDQRTSRYRL